MQLTALCYLSPLLLLYSYNLFVIILKVPKNLLKMLNLISEGKQPIVHSTSIAGLTVALSNFPNKIKYTIQRFKLFITTEKKIDKVT